MDICYMSGIWTPKHRFTVVLISLQSREHLQVLSRECGTQLRGPLKEGVNSSFPAYRTSRKKGLNSTQKDDPHPQEWGNLSHPPPPQKKKKTNPLPPNPNKTNETKKQKHKTRLCPPPPQQNTEKTTPLPPNAHPKRKHKTQNDGPKHTKLKEKKTKRKQNTKINDPRPTPSPKQDAAVIFSSGGHRLQDAGPRAAGAWGL